MDDHQNFVFDPEWASAVNRGLLIARVNQMNTRYNQGMQNSISECTV